MGELTHVDFGGHPAGSGVPPARRALLNAKKWSARRQLAEEEYAKAILECRRHGLGFTEIARAVGKTEGAVRLMVKRRTE